MIYLDDSLRGHWIVCNIAIGEEATEASGIFDQITAQILYGAN